MEGGGSASRSGFPEPGCDCHSWGPLLQPPLGGPSLADLQSLTRHSWHCPLTRWLPAPDLCCRDMLGATHRDEAAVNNGPEPTEATAQEAGIKTRACPDRERTPSPSDVLIRGAKCPGSGLCRGGLCRRDRECVCVCVTLRDPGNGLMGAQRFKGSANHLGFHQPLFHPGPASWKGRCLIRTYTARTHNRKCLVTFSKRSIFSYNTILLLWLCWKC